MTSRTTELLLKKKLGKISLPELKELNELLKSSRENKYMSEAIDDLFSRGLLFEEETIEKSMMAAFNTISKSINSETANLKVVRRPLAWKKIIGIAASLMFIAIMAYLFLMPKKEIAGNNQLISTVTEKGSKTTLSLPDGTKVWLNSDSKLTYKESFGKTIREVTLEGEAYFDVIKDNNRPFIVQTKAIDIKVLGTAFNVKAYPDELNTQTTLLRGSVEVIFKKQGHDKILLKPNEKLIVQNRYAISDSSDKSIKQMPVITLLKTEETASDSTVAEIKWTKNQLVFEDEKLTDIISMLERWYNVEIIVQREIPADKRFNGTFNNENITDVLEALKLFENFNYTIEKDKVTIY